MQRLRHAPSIAIAAALCALAPAAARGERLPVRLYGTADGLASVRVNGIVRDQRGFLWFATIEGVSRFDGERFESFGAADGLPDPICLGATVTGDGALWIGTASGLARLDLDQVGARPRFTTAIAGEEVRLVFEDSQGRRWAGGAGGLARLDGDGPAGIARVPLRAGRQPYVFSIAEDRERTLWLGTSAGLVRRTAGGAVEIVPLFSRAGEDGRVTAVYVDRAGRLWIGGVQGGLLALVPPPAATPIAPAGRALWDVAGAGKDASGAIVVPRAVGELIGYPTGTVFPSSIMRWGILEDARGDLWFGGDALVRFDGHRFVALGPRDGIPDHGVGPAVEDTAGNLWLMTFERGALRLATGGMTSFGVDDGLTNPDINGVTEDEDGTIVAIIEHDGHLLARLEGDRFVGVRPRLPPGVKWGAWGENQIELVDRDGRWWFATGEGAAHYPRVARVQELADAMPDWFGVAQGLPGHDVLRLWQDTRGDVWISAVAPAGVARWDRASDRLVALHDAALPHAAVLAFAEDRGGGVWLGYDDGHLARLPGGETTGLRTLGAAEGVPADQVNALLVDHRGALWVATTAGLVRLDDPTAPRPAVVRYDTAAGLGTDHTTALAEDDHGRIYVGTLRGVDRLDPESGAIGHLSTADGLPGDIVHTVFRDRRGALWFGVAGGLAKLVPAPERAVPPPIAYLTWLRAGGVVRGLAAGGARAARPITLDAHDGQLDVGFTSPSFAPGLPVELEYRLAGAEQAWHRAGTAREVHYAHLAPGGYRFEVRARYPGQEPSAAAVVSVEVLAPLWRRPWFIALVAAALALAGYALYRWRVRHLLAVERVRTRIATDLHDDLGASLSRIAILSEVAARRTGAGEAGEIVGEIGASARALVDVASDIVWATDPRRDDLGSLLARLRVFAGDVLEARGVVWRLDAPDEPERIELDPDRRRHLYLVVKEAINNAARHARARHVTIRVTRHGHGLEAIVEDDGRGIATAAGEGRGNGLANMRARAAAAGGTLTIDDAPGGGTRVTLRLP